MCQFSEVLTVISMTPAALWCGPELRAGDRNPSQLDCEASVWLFGWAAVPPVLPQEQLQCSRPSILGGTFSRRKQFYGGCEPEVGCSAH